MRELSKSNNDDPDFLKGAGDELNGRLVDLFILFILLLLDTIGIELFIIKSFDSLLLLVVVTGCCNFSTLLSSLTKLSFLIFVLN